MVAAYALIAVVVGALGILFLWPTSPLLALLSAPFIASAAVLIAAVASIMLKRNDSLPFLAPAE